MDKSKFDKLIELREKLYTEVKQILSEINEAFPVDGINYLYISGFTEFTIYLEGEEKTHNKKAEYYNLHFPSEIIYDKQKRLNFINERKERMKEWEQEEQKRILELKQKQIEDEYKKYLELKKKFGDT